MSAPKANPYYKKVESAKSSSFIASFVSDHFISWVHVYSLVKLCIDIWNEWTFLLVIADRLMLTGLQIKLRRLFLQVRSVLEDLIGCLWQFVVKITAVGWALPWILIFERSRIEFPERVLFEVFFFAEVVSFFALSCHLLCHHIDIDLLSDPIGIREWVANQVVGYPVR